MLMQMLEVKFYFSCLAASLKVELKVLRFIHDLNIAHRLSTLSIVSIGPPLGGSFSTELEQYALPQAPEFASGIAYSPFKLMFGNWVSVSPTSR